MGLLQSRGATGRGSAIGRSIEEEREIKQARQWAEAKRSAGRWGFGCLFLALLAAFALVYLAGYVTGEASEARRPEVTSTR